MWICNASKNHDAKMEPDLSCSIYEKQQGPDFHPATFTLTDGRVLEGVIIAFCFGDPVFEEPFITKWHIAPLKEAMLCGRGLFGSLTGEFIHHHHLAKVVFADGTTFVIPS